MDDDTPQVPDGPEYRKDGTTLLFVDGQRWNRLKRAKLGELRELRESLEELSDEALRLTAKAAIDRPDKPAPDADADAKVSYTLASRENQRHLNAAIEGLHADWIRQAFSLLADHGPPAEDAEWPPWLIEPEFINGLIRHLQSVPLARGTS